MTEVADEKATDSVIDSQELADTLNIKARKHRDFCNDKIRDAEKQLGHWREQYNIITAFLAENQISDNVKSDEPWFDPNASVDPDPEMTRHVQNLRDEVRNSNQGWNYGPTDLR